MRKNFEYSAEHQSEISFPLGGIGSGCIGLGGNGRLTDWEIFNRPAKGSYNGLSHFAVRAEDEGGVLGARILNGDLNPSYTGPLGTDDFYEGFGWGPRRETMAGMPHFEQNSFKGTFPIAELGFRDDSFPGEVVMEAFNPFIPHQADDSSIPAAFFQFTVKNNSDRPLNYSLTAVVGNPYKGRTRNRFVRKDGLAALLLDSQDSPERDPGSGNLCLASDAETVSYQEYLYRGEWFDALEVYWKDTMTPGPYRARSYEPDDRTIRDNALLSAHIDLKPGESRQVRFIISWSHPVNRNDWGRMTAGRTTPYTEEEKEWLARGWKNYYATVWKDSADSAVYGLRHWDRLFDATKAFRDSLFSASLPEAVLDSVSANISLLKSPTVWRLEDGTLYGWEGVGEKEGSCEGSCTHVWGYAQALPFLFPELSRSMREAEYRYNWAEDGSMTFRLMLPAGSPRWHFRPAVDGQFATVMKAYREWKISGDEEWLRGLWPRIKASLEFAWSEDNVDLWDPGKTGVLTGRQHHTLDMELFGPNAWLSGMYLGALKAASEMAAAMGEEEGVSEYLSLFEKGCRILNEKLYNGTYFIQDLDLKDKEILKPYADKDQFNLVKDGGSIYDVYWSDELGELKYQIGKGVGIDQMLGQWHADLYGLGEIFDGKKVESALNALMRYNFRETMREHYNPCRLYCLNDESGLVICSWPEGEERPAIPAPYSQETMHGFEYAAADLMIKRGMVEDGLKVVKGIRDRYDGRRRNPWNEFECGSNYARSMASYALLLSYSGFSFDGRSGYMGFKPIVGGDFCFPWSFQSAWGQVKQEGSRLAIVVMGGTLSLVSLGVPKDLDIRSLTLNGNPLGFEKNSDCIVFERKLDLKTGDSLFFC